MKPTGFVQIAGRKLVLDGREIRMEGVSLGNWLLFEAYMLGLPYIDHGIRRAMADVWGRPLAGEFLRRLEDSYITEADIKAIKAMGFNYVRVPFRYRLLEDDARPGHYLKRGWALLDRVIRWGRKHGMFVLLDLHATQGAQATDWNSDCVTGQALLWEDAGYQQRLADLWGAIAERYADEPWVLGYEIMCEPVVHDHAVLRRVYRQALAAIRAVDRRHVIFLDGDLWARDIASLSTDLFDGQTMPHVHLYMQQRVPAARMSAYPAVVDGKRIDRDEIRRQIDDVVDEKRIRRPVMFGEFGLGPASRPFMFDLYADYLGLIRQRGYHWGLWAWKDLGALGLMRPAPGNPWRTYIEETRGEPRSKQFGDLLRVDFTAGSRQGRLGEEIRSLYPEVDEELIKRQSREALRAMEKVKLYAQLQALKRLPRQRLLAMAEAFSLQHCEVQEPVMKMIRSLLEADPA